MAPLSKKTSLLYEISGSSIQKSHLFGSVHIPLDFAANGSLELFSYLGKAQMLLSETNLNAPFDPSDFPKVDWRPHLSPTQLNKLRRTVQKYYGFDISLFLRWPPMILMMTLAQLDLSPNDRNTMDLQLWRAAEKKGIPTVGISDYKVHYRNLYKMAIEEQISQLKKYIGNISLRRKENKRLLDLYKKANLHQLYIKSAKALGSLRTELLVNRNYEMLAIMMQHMTKEKTFTVVGAAHLGGTHGLIAQLKHQYQLQCKPI